MPYADPKTRTEKRREYRERKREMLRKAAKAYYASNRERAKVSRRQRYLRNREKELRQMTDYRKCHSGEIRTYHYRHCRRPEERERRNQVFRKRYADDPNFKLTSVLRGRIRIAVKKQYGTKASRTKELVGCDITFLRSHLERQFKRGMTWKNFGTAWQIDHIIPCVAFDLTNPIQQKQCFHFSNLQPLRCGDNRRKWDTITDPQMKLLM